MKKDLHYSNKVLILIILLNGLSWGQNEYNLENLIFTGERFSKSLARRSKWFSIYFCRRDQSIFGRNEKW